MTEISEPALHFTVSWANSTYAPAAELNTPHEGTLLGQSIDGSFSMLRILYELYWIPVIDPKTQYCDDRVYQIHLLPLACSNSGLPPVVSTAPGIVDTSCVVSL